MRKLYFVDHWNSLPSWVVTASNTKGRLHQPHLNRHLANGHLTLSSH